MKRFTFTIAIMAAVVLIGVAVVSAQSSAVTLTYGDVEISRSSGAGADHFPNIWDLSTCDMTLSFTYDGNGLVDDLGAAVAHAYPQFGIRTVGRSDFNPTNGGVWMGADYDEAANTFDPDPALDVDDWLSLQRAAGQSTGAYNLPAIPPDPRNNHRFAFDRDGVTADEAAHPLAVDGGTYNTEGTYDIVISLHATASNSGEAYMTINGLAQGFETDGDDTTMELSPAGVTFAGNMAQMQIYYGLFAYGATHSVAFRDITIDGCLSDAGPLIRLVDARPNPVAAGSDVIVVANATGGPNVVSAEFSIDGTSWQPMNAQDGAFDSAGEDVTATFTPAEAGLYRLCVHGTDAAGNTGSAACIPFIVYDEDSFVTGGGWFDSANPAGRAELNVVVRYERDATVPSGRLQFAIDAQGWKFQSDAYELLAINDGSATLQGSGTLHSANSPDGQPYRFYFHVDDGRPDAFHFKIFYLENGMEMIVYDSGAEQHLRGGNVEVHER